MIIILQVTVVVCFCLPGHVVVSRVNALQFINDRLQSLVFWILNIEASITSGADTVMEAQSQKLGSQRLIISDQGLDGILSIVNLELNQIV